MLTRRQFLWSMFGGVALPGLLGGYAFAIEPRFRLSVTGYRIRTPRLSALSAGKPLRVAVLADFHTCEPWMPVSRIKHIVATTNELKPDLIVLLGDYVAGLRRFRTAIVPMRDWSRSLSHLEAPLGTYAVLGNHDWWVDGTATADHLESSGIPVLEKRAIQVTHPNGNRFWLAGLGDQWAIPLGGERFRSVDDLAGTLGQIADDTQPVLLPAHEPDIFPRVPARVDLMLSGHTHGGQVRLPFLGAPVVPSRYGQRFAYGHITEDDR